MLKNVLHGNWISEHLANTPFQDLNSSNKEQGFLKHNGAQYVEEKTTGRFTEPPTVARGSPGPPLEGAGVQQ